MRFLAAGMALAAVVAGPTPGGRPAVSGVLQQGRQLVASPGSWSGSGLPSYAYQWSRCTAIGGTCSSIHGATKATYTLVAKDVGSTVALTVRATDATGTTPAYAPLAGPIASRSAVLAATSQPTLTGNAVIGTPLAIAGDAWTVSPTQTTATWSHCNPNARLCSAIPHATGSTYTPTADDTGRTIVAAVTATSGAERQTVLSLPSVPVRAAPGPAALAPPTVAGTLRQGSQLTATAGNWSGDGPTTYAFQWSRCSATGATCSSIRGATKATYTLVAKDVGSTVALAVRASDRNGTTPAYAGLAGPIAAGNATLAATSQPTLIGSPLTVSGGGWTVASETTAIVWERCNANGRLCASIAGATGSTYAPTADDAGHAILAAVTVTAGTARLGVLTVPAIVLG